MRTSVADRCAKAVVQRMVFEVETRSKYLLGVKLDKLLLGSNEGSSELQVKNGTNDVQPSLTESFLSLTDREETEGQPANVKLASSIDAGIDFSKRNSCVTTKRIIPLNDEQVVSFSEPELMKKSVLKEGFEKLYTVPPYVESVRALRRERKKQREKTKGENWYHLPATELTEEHKNDLIALQMRKSWFPKQFYKKNDLTVLPKYFQVGTVVETPADFYHARIPKKQRKRTLVEELLADADFRRYNKEKYQKIIANQPLKKRIASKKSKKSK